MVPCLLGVVLWLSCLPRGITVYSLTLHSQPTVLWGFGSDLVFLLQWCVIYPRLWTWLTGMSTLMYRSICPEGELFVYNEPKDSPKLLKETWATMFDFNKGLYSFICTENKSLFMFSLSSKPEPNKERQHDPVRHDDLPSWWATTPAADELPACRWNQQTCQLKG